MGFQPVEELMIAEQAVLDNFGVAAPDFARGQGFENVEVTQDQARLPEGADQVLALLVVDGCLAADRGIDLSQQRRGNLYEIDAALDDAGGESGQIANYAAAERNHQIPAVDLAGDQLTAEIFQRRESLGVLASRQHDLLANYAFAIERGAQCRQM